MPSRPSSEPSAPRRKQPIPATLNVQMAGTALTVSESQLDLAVTDAEIELVLSILGDTIANIMRGTE